MSLVFEVQKAGMEQTGDHRSLVTFMDDGLGCVDDAMCRLEPIDDPFGPKLLPMFPEWSVTDVSGMDLWETGAGDPT